MRNKPTKRVVVPFGVKPEAKALLTEAAAILDVPRAELIRAVLRKSIGNKTDPATLAAYIGDDVIRL